MTEEKLNALKDLPAPPPRAEAKAAALAAAMAAFDAPAENIDQPTQGSADVTGLMHASKTARRQKMRAPMLYKIAAGIAVVLVATPAALYFIDQRSDLAPELRIATEERDARKRPVTQLDGTGKPDSNTGNREVAPDVLAPPPIAQDQDMAGSPQPRNAAKLSQVQPLQSQSAPASAGEGRADISPPIPKSAPQPFDVEDYYRFGANQSFGDEAASPATKPAPKPEVKTHAIGMTTTFEKGFAPPNLPVEAPRERQLTQAEEEHRDQFQTVAPSPVKQVAAEPVSTFSIDVDTASYAFVRRALNAGQLPPKDAVRVEEMINYFPYNYPRPETAETPFQPTVTVVPAPWKPSNKLIHIGIKGYDLSARERPRANLVFLIDISGSMQPQDRLPLLKNAFRMLVDELKPEDTVGIVTYASGSGVALEPTQVSQKEKILAAIDALGAGGSTAGAQGIADAYRLAEAHFDKGGVNRIILATDGDFNVGISNRDELKGFVERKRQAGIFLSVLGVGEGNYNDALMQVLAQNGNGTAAYVDTLNEARKVLVDEASSTLFTIAKDVKIQVEFNPAQVSEYRLIGYETRALRREDFNNDKVDAGDIGSGHTVTAIYEVTPASAPKLVDNLRYGKPVEGSAAAPDGELGLLKLRYKLPNEDTSKLITLPITPALEKPEIAAAPEDVRFSVAVAAFGQLLRGSPYLQTYGYDEALALAQPARGADPYGYRAELANLMRLAKSARP